MDTRTGEVFRRAVGENQADFFRRIGRPKKFMVEFSESDMTAAQKERLRNSNQPVVRPKDQRSPLAMTRNQRKRFNRALRSPKKK